VAVERRPRPRPERPSPERVERLRRLAELHRAWTTRHLQQAPFRPEGRRDGSDYNQHYLDLEATGDAEDEFMTPAREILGLDPVTGRPPGSRRPRRRRES
jgi:hypothetical protein